jgi:hypothetical protein
MPNFRKRANRDNPTNTQQWCTNNSIAIQSRLKYNKSDNPYYTCLSCLHLFGLVFTIRQDIRNKIKFKLPTDCLQDINYYTNKISKLCITTHTLQKTNTPDKSGQPTVTHKQPANARPPHLLQDNKLPP